jgi:hypothetical protein
MGTRDIIITALEDYDNHRSTINYLKTNASIRLDVTNRHSNNRRSVITFKDNFTGETIIETEYEFLGIYLDSYHIWNWAWSTTQIQKSEMNISIELLQYGLNLLDKHPFIRYLLTNSRYFIKDKSQLDIIIAICSYVTKNSYIYNFEYQTGNQKIIYYLILLDKDAMDELTKKINS